VVRAAAFRLLMQGKQSTLVSLIDYGCHSFTYRLSGRLNDLGIGTRYLVNGSLESPNLSSLPRWIEERPEMVSKITCKKPYGKMSLLQRLQGEAEWGGNCIRALEADAPAVVVVSCIPLTAVTRIESWCRRHDIPLIYWLQDIQSRAIYDLLGAKLGFAGRTLGAFAHLWEQELLIRSRMVITIAPRHERELPLAVLREKRYRLLENWGNLEDFPRVPVQNDWAARHGLAQTINVMYTGTLGLKHDLHTFFELGRAFRERPDVRIVIVSSGQAADYLRLEAVKQDLGNLVVLPFQAHEDLPKVLATAAVLVAPLDPAAGSFCVPSKILSYLCAGRPIVLAINSDNLAAKTIAESKSGFVVRPGDARGFVDAVTRLVTHAGERFERGRNARAYAEEAFNLDSVVEKFTTILAESGVSFGSVLARKQAGELAHSAAGT
jgi:colanic acid biosynthesis glycosyl transferase WcaI